MSLVTVITAPVVAAAQFPNAAFASDPAFGVIGSVVRLDGRASSDPDQLPLTYAWRFVSVPIGSQVRGEGFRALELDTSGSAAVVSFSPDVVGEYVVGLVVSNGVFSSPETISTVRIRAILVPHGRGIIPDGKFIWSYVRDVWSQVDGKEFFETLWSALIQIVGSEMLKLYQTDFSKSIRDIQDRYQRRWLSYEPKLLLENGDLSFFIGGQLAGKDASTVNLGLEGLAVILSSGEVVVVSGARLQNVAGETLTILFSEDPSNVGTHTLAGLNNSRTGYRLDTPSLDPAADFIAGGTTWLFSQGSTVWEMDGGNLSQLAVSLSQWAPLGDSLLPLFNRGGGGGSDDIKKGDVIHIPSGPNAGFYRILEKNGSQVTVNHAPPGSSLVGSTVPADVYRPVGFEVSQPLQSTTNTFSIPLAVGADASTLAPGRLVVVGGQAFTIVRSVVDRSFDPPIVVVTLSTGDAISGLSGLNWRAPNTLNSASQNFEALGVTTGDLLAVDILHVESGTVSEVPAQVVGVKGNSLGFVFSDGEVSAGEVPSVPNKTIMKLANDFGINGVAQGSDGSLVYSGTALSYVNRLSSGVFKREYLNKELTSSDSISVNPLFQIKPKHIIRNRLIPVDENLRSVPTLQEWITQPTLADVGGKVFQVVRGKSFELDRKPSILGENLDYIIDDELVFDGQMTINTGSAEIDVDDADFVDRGMVPGDLFIIEAPLTISGTYVIEKVLSNTRVRLTRQVPAYALGPLAISKILLKRKKTGHFLRFVPGLFTAQNPAPDRLWAEVSFFDNDQVIEDNFGILVGLKKETLDSVSRDISYRQAVAGLMYAFTRGSALDKVRLGAQILLGLPFAEHRGVVKSIEDDYRLDINGTPVLGRLLIEDVDATGRLLGTLRIYLYPIDAASVLSGIDTNPATGVPYVVGDTVELFAPLSKGVEIIDYLTNPGDVGPSAIDQLQKYHSVKLRANDNIFSLDELDLVSDFLRKITPSYVSYSLITASEFVDVVNIADLLAMGLHLGGNDALVDNASLGLPATLMFDSRTPEGIPQILWEDGVLSVRRVGSDLETFGGTSSAFSAAGGFMNPKAHEEFEGPLVISGDVLVILSGTQKGVYPIQNVGGDGTVDVSGLPFGFAQESGLRFFIARKVTGLLSQGVVNVTNGSATASFPFTPQLRSKGVAPGDWLVLSSGSFSRRHLIKTVYESSPGSGEWSRIEMDPPANNTSLYDYWIYRPSLFVSGTYTVASSGGNVLDYSASPELSGIADTGDELVVGSLGVRVMVLDPIAMYCTPALPAGSYSVTLAKRNRPTGAVGWDHIEKFDPTDELEVSLVETQALASCTSTDVVSFQVERTTAPASGPVAWDPEAAGVLPGDVLVITSGANALIDYGNGPGVYPIVEVSSSDVTLSNSTPNSESCSWKIVRRR